MRVYSQGILRPLGKPVAFQVLTNNPRVTTLRSRIGPVTVGPLGEIVTFEGMEPRGINAVTNAGSWYQDATGAWVQTTEANELKPLYEGGVDVGFVFDPARGPVNSAPVHNTVPTSGQPGFATQSGGTGTLTFEYAGQHGAADRYGTTGKGVLVTVNSGNSRLVAFDGQAMAFAPGEFALVGISFAIPSDVTVPAGTVMLIVFPKQISGTIPGGQITATMGDDGRWAFTVPGAVRRGGGEFIRTFNGRDEYFAWWEQRVTTACTIAPQTRTPNVNVPGFKMLIEECWVEKTNGYMRPRPTPVMANDVTLAKEGISIGGPSERFDAWFYRSGVAVRGAPGNLIGPTNFRWTGPVRAGEDRIVVRPSTYSDDAPVLLPSDNNKRALSVFGVNETIDCLIDGHFRVTIDERDGLTNAQRTGTRINIRSAFGRVDPASVEMVDTSQSFVTHIDGAEFIHLLTSDTSTNELNAIGQAHIWVTPAARLRASTAIDCGDWAAFGSHSGHHGRWERFMPADAGSDNGVDYDNLLDYSQKSSRCYWYGTALFTVSNGGTITVGRWLNNQIGNGTRFLVGATDNVTINRKFDDTSIYSRRTFNDGFNIGSGRYTMNPGPFYVFEPSTYLDLDLYHCPPGQEIQVDTGSGWQALSASSYTQDTLPCNRWFERWGDYDPGTNTLTSAPNPAERIRIAYWKLANIGGVADKPGFQFHASRVVLSPTTETTLNANTVYVSLGAGTPQSPHIRVVRGDGVYLAASPSTWTTTPGQIGTQNRPVGYHSGMHSDAGQFNFSQLTNVKFGPAVLINPAGQGFMIQGQETSPARSTIVECLASEIIAFVGAANGVLIQGDNTTGTNVQVEKSALIVAEPGLRFINGGIGEPGRFHILGCGAATIDPATTVTMRRVLATTGTPNAGDGVITQPWSGQPAVDVTGRPRQIVGPNIAPTITPAEPLLDGEGNIIEPTIAQVVENPETVLAPSGLPEAYGNLLGKFRFSETGQAYLGWDANALLDRAEALRESWLPVIRYMADKQRDWLYDGARATVPNNTAVNDEIVLTDVDGNVAQFPGYMIDELTGDGMGRHGYFRISAEGRLFLRRALTGINDLMIVTLTPPTGRPVNLRLDIVEPSPAVAPEITEASITGTPQDGQVLTANVTFTGDPTPTVAYQWQVRGVNISGQTASTITLDAAGMGLAVDDVISCEIAATNEAGTATAEPTIVYTGSAADQLQALLTGKTGTGMWDFRAGGGDPLTVANIAGTANGFTQVLSANNPAINATDGAIYDGLNDELRLLSAPTGNVSFYVLLKKDPTFDAQGHIFNGQTLFEPGSGVGMAYTVSVDGGSVLTTRGALHTALDDDAWHIIAGTGKPPPLASGYVPLGRNSSGCPRKSVRAAVMLLESEFADIAAARTAALAWLETLR